jgi:DNA-binding CsgD family transcriptional regulator
MNDQKRLNWLTPRERDVYEMWREHPDWTNGQIGRAVLFPAGHIVLRYKSNIRRKLGLQPDDQPGLGGPIV